MKQIERKKIPGFENYEITSDGRIYSIKSEKYLKSSKDPSGHPQATLSNNGKIRCIKIHKLVAETFIPNPDPSFYKSIEWIDGDRTNNSVENLKWVPNLQNVQKLPRYRNTITGKIYNTLPELLADLSIIYEREY